MARFHTATRSAFRFGQSHFEPVFNFSVRRDQKKTRNPLVGACDNPVFGLRHDARNASSSFKSAPAWKHKKAGRNTNVHVLLRGAHAGSPFPLASINPLKVALSKWIFFTWVPGILLGEQIPVRRMASERKQSSMTRWSVSSLFPDSSDSNLTRLAWPVSSRQPPCLSRTRRWPRPH